MTFRLKRGAAPRTWTIPRKGTKWVKRPAPGPHAQDESIPILQVIRDLRHLAATAREVRLLLRSGKVRVDGKVIKDLSRGIGLMDTVSFDAPLNEHFRLLKDHRGKLSLVAIAAGEATTKLGRVRFKHSVPGGKIEVTLHDGRNLLVARDSPWRVGDTLKLELPGQKVLGHVALAAGSLAFVSGGSHVGELARVDRVEVRNSSQPNLVHFKEGFSTIHDYVFIVGDAAPMITLPEGLNR
ncbi:MAG: 30S ribosomal protein S4e [Thermoplasmata archaeon]|nr:30S ribosomal protein S4e [Thermoplasmata archaeon]